MQWFNLPFLFLWADFYLYNLSCDLCLFVCECPNTIVLRRVYFCQLWKHLEISSKGKKDNIEKANGFHKNSNMDNLCMLMSV